MTRNYKFDYIQFEQPSGIFLFTIIPASQLLKFYTINRREYTGDTSFGTQRKLNPKRVEDIADFCNTVDSSFPTSIIIAAKEPNYEIVEDERKFVVKGLLEIIDGQHRIEGIKRASEKYGEESINKFQLPCIVVLEATEEQKAFLFATINGEQQKVPRSVVYDLFGVSEVNDPYRILHTTARKLNFDTESPFFKRLKMLGFKSKNIDSESLSQGTFIKEIIPKMTSDPLRDRNIIKTKGFKYLPEEPERVLRLYIFEEGHDYLFQLFKHLFNAVKNTWPKEWEDHSNYILSKTTGYIGIIKGIDPVIKFGIESNNVSELYFKRFFGEVKKILIEKNIPLTNEFFPSGSVGQNNLRDFLSEAWGKFHLMVQNYSEDTY